MQAGGGDRGQRICALLGGQLCCRRQGHACFNPPTSRSLPLFQQYLQSRIGLQSGEEHPQALDRQKVQPNAERMARGRYKGNAIGNAQNYLVRNILSRLGEETFGQTHWEAVVASFDHGCAYCGAKGEIAMDHVIPTNKQSPGEHRLGNIVPACRSCNARKADRSIAEFLAHDTARLEAIRLHAEKHDYTPIADEQRLRQILELAHEELRQLADRYVTIINAVIKSGPAPSID